MKKLLKKIFAGISALTIMMISAISSSAILIKYDLDNEDYIEYINNYCNGGEKIPNDEILLPAVGGGDYRHIYKGRVSVQNKIIYGEHNFEYVIDGIETKRYFTTGSIYWNILSSYYEKNFWSNHTVEEIEAFFAENNLNNEIVSIEAKCNDFEKYPQGSDSVTIKFVDGVDFSVVTETVAMLYNEYNLRPRAQFLASSIGFSGSLNTTTEPTLLGDLNLDNEQGIADIAILAKYNASSGLFPISDQTALANADVNQDGAVDSIDTLTLIEIMLGTYESAV